MIVETYTQYWRVLGDAGRSSPEQARRLLKPFVAGDYLDHLVAGVRRMSAQEREPYGRVIPRLKQVLLAGTYAEVIDCQDQSQAAMADRGTHEVIPETTQGKATANIKATLEKSADGRWRLTGVTIKGASCAPPSP